LANRPKIALVGYESPLGREIREVAATSEPAIDVRLIAADEQRAGTLTAVGDEPALVAGLDAASLAGVDAVFLAGSEAASRKALDLADLEPGPVIVDLTSVAEERPDARLRAPSVESEAASEAMDAPRVQVVAHPAAIALSLFLRRLQARHPLRRAVVQIFAPASEHGMKGVEELQQQTVSLLSFKSLPKAVFDAQLGFTLLARYGQEAPAPLERVELSIERHLATLLELPGEGAGAPMPSLRLIQAPVFHGYSFSAWIEFEKNPGIDALEKTLACDWIDVRGADFEPPTNVGQAGQGGIAVGAIAQDRNQPAACWFWVVADNFRLAAENAVALARRLK
jgi:aspartate-semialdehyde dehydrogenase